MTLYDRVKEVWKTNKVEFERRTSEWAENFKINSAIVKSNRGKFRAWSPLGVYVSYSSTKKGEFSIRYCGQEVGILRMVNGEKSFLIDARNYELNRKFFSLNDCEVGSYPWDGGVARHFRNHFNPNPAIKS